MSKINQLKRDIGVDIDKIKKCIESENIDELKSLHKYLDGKYQSKINTWGLSQFNWMDGIGFDYEYMNIEACKDNLINMIGKLEGYKRGLDLMISDALSKQNASSVKIYNNNDNNNSNVNINSVITTVDFKKVEEKITNNESLTEAQTKEAIDKLKELEEIYESKESRKSKWDKAKNIMLWIADKSVDIGIAFLPLLTSIFGG